MGSPTASTHLFSSKSSSSFLIPNSSLSFLKYSNPPFISHLHLHLHLHPKLTHTSLHLKTTNTSLPLLRFSTAKTRATLDEADQDTNTPLLLQQKEQKPNKEIDECVKLLKNAAKTRRVAAEEVLSALSVIEKAKLDPSGFLETLGGSKSPGRTWMLVFTAKKGLKSGIYFPITAVQRQSGLRTEFIWDHWDV